MKVFAIPSAFRSAAVEKGVSHGNESSHFLSAYMLDEKSSEGARFCIPLQ